MQQKIYIYVTNITRYSLFVPHPLFLRWRILFLTMADSLVMNKGLYDSPRSTVSCDPWSCEQSALSPQPRTSSYQSPNSFPFSQRQRPLLCSAPRDREEVQELWSIRYSPLCLVWMKGKLVAACLSADFLVGFSSLFLKILLMLQIICD